MAGGWSENERAPEAEVTEALKSLLDEEEGIADQEKKEGENQTFHEGGSRKTNEKLQSQDPNHFFRFFQQAEFRVYC